MTETDWDRVFRPRSVALLGATGRADSPMARPLRWLAERGFAGSVWPVNPKYDELGGLPCFRSLDSLPGTVDLVLALVPADRAEDAVRAAGRAGAAAVVVFASGFAEVGPDGAERQRRLVAAARQTGVRVLGPNCQGLLHAPSRLFATFSAAAERPLDGRSGIAYVGQSGAIGGSVLDLAAEQGLELTAWVSTGNQADVDLTEIGRHLVHDPAVSVLAVYAESVADGAAYALLASEAAAAGTALVVLRTGRSDAGRRAVVSHTGAMVGDDTAFRLVSRRHDVVLVDDVEELLAAATVLRSRRRPGGRRIAAVTTSGGAGILAADRCAGEGLELPELAPETQDELARLVPAFGALANPVDVTAQLFNSGERTFGDVCSVVCADPSVDALMVLVTMVLDDDATALAEDVVAAVSGGTVPCSVVWLASRDRTAGARDVLRGAGVPVFSSVAVAARVAGALAPADPPPAGRDRTGGGGTAGSAATRAISTPFTLADGAPARRTDLVDGWELLDALGVPTPSSRLVGTGPDAATAAAGLGGTVVLKAVADGLEHRTEHGAVRLGITPEHAAATFDELAAAVPGLVGVLVQRQVPDGLELLVGGRGGRDGWPPVLTVGLGGTATEVHRDIVTALAPVSRDAAMALLRRLRCWPLLDGHRGAAPLDVEAAVDVVVRIGAALAARPDLDELEVNPLIVGRHGALAVDVLLRAHPG